MLGSLWKTIRWCWWGLGGGLGKGGEKACKAANSTLVVGNDLALCFSALSGRSGGGSVSKTFILHEQRITLGPGVTGVNNSLLVPAGAREDLGLHVPVRF